MRRHRRQHEEVEMQMGPMIDMVFLLLVFFMVTSKPIKEESDLSMTLPGSVAQEESVEIPDEQRIVIDGRGQVFLNEMAFDSPDSREMPQLTATLKRFKEAAVNNQSEPLVTISLHKRAELQRVVDVLGACSLSGLTKVTFADSGPEGGGQ
ncbi:MAG: biopolymer transporter ExbD [Verrucomicrobiota bacterium]